MKAVTTRQIERATHYVSYDKAYKLSSEITIDKRVIEHDGYYIACGDTLLSEGKQIQLYGRRLTR